MLRKPVDGRRGGDEGGAALRPQAASPAESVGEVTCRHSQCQTGKPLCGCLLGRSASIFRTLQDNGCRWLVIGGR